MYYFITHGSGERGAERVCKILLDELKQSGISYKVLVCGGKKFNDHESLCLDGGYLRLFLIWIYDVIKSIKRNEAVTVIFLNGNFIYINILIKTFLRLNKILNNKKYRLVMWEHCLPKTHFIANGRLRKIYLFFSKRSYKSIVLRSTKICGPSPVIVKQLQVDFKIHGVDSKYTLLKNPIVVSVTRNEHFLNEELVKFVYAGAYSFEKQPRLAIDTIVKLRLLTKTDNIVLNMYGKGDKKKEITAYVEKMGYGSFVNINEYSTNICDVINSADALICSSMYETYCNVIAESLLLSKTVLTTKWEGIEEIYADSKLFYIENIESNYKLLLNNILVNKDKKNGLYKNFEIIPYLESLIGEVL